MSFLADLTFGEFAQGFLAICTGLGTLAGIWLAARRQSPSPILGNKSGDPPLNTCEAKAGTTTSKEKINE